MGGKDTGLTGNIIWSQNCGRPWEGCLETDRGAEEPALDKSQQAFRSKRSRSSSAMPSQLEAHGETRGQLMATNDDPEDHFFRACAGRMQKMQPEQNSLLQLRIMEPFHQAEAAPFQVRTLDAHASVTHAPSP
ncbi:hypothetical protein CAPTEDRAFT_197852 [Capitella teleta]|uniref:Uncharacterized protein n=1 Tax=Capitella teleta TaxID=283909 RepID=R7T349_CAPTE|nr:hypothetical protein CAPTEDRAFT_197852 [Capitella teleta]|eukprot:ELT87077.1 hypothetical protein CAPTEDRAFT_197852 [Capitella teleta]